VRRKITTRNVSVNIAKVVTIFCLLALPFLYPLSIRAAVYLAMHVSYCMWYLLKQLIMGEPVFRERDSIFDVGLVVASVGVFYTLPGWLAFTNPQPVSQLVLGVSVSLFFFGSVINSSADVQKSASLRVRPGLITDGFWRLSRNINYFGNLMRYSSFALLAGSVWAWSVVLFVLVIDIDRMRKKSASLSRYPEYRTYSEKVPALLPYGFLRWFRRGGDG
jgi:protein-S-isoprenylcysteine O-methyltransferase Ste14